jgi:hypothetical protein
MIVATEYTEGTEKMEANGLRAIIQAPAVPVAKTTSVVYVRLPPSVHAALKDIAERRETSLNRLCVAVLERVVGMSREPAGAARCPECGAAAELVCRACALREDES